MFFVILCRYLDKSSFQKHIIMQKTILFLFVFIVGIKISGRHLRKFFVSDFGSGRQSQ